MYSATLPGLSSLTSEVSSAWRPLTRSSSMDRGTPVLVQVSSLVRSTSWLAPGQARIPGWLEACEQRVAGKCEIATGGHEVAQSNVRLPMVDCWADASAW